MFSFTNKKDTDACNSEVDSMKKDSKMADFHFFNREQLADVLLLVLELDMSCSSYFCHIAYRSIFLI